MSPLGYGVVFFITVVALGVGFSIWASRREEAIN